MPLGARETSKILTVQSLLLTTSRGVGASACELGNRPDPIELDDDRCPYLSELGGGR